MADESTSITLTLYQDGQLVREELFDRSVINVGKQASSNLRLDDVNISRKHAVIERRQEGRWRITDLGSTNGTIVNGRQITQANLRDGDRISLGNTTMVVHLGGKQPHRDPAASAGIPVDNRPTPEIPGLGENSFYHLTPEEESATEMVMEVALLWGKSMLTIQHYDKPETIEIGEIPGCHFFLPEEALGIPRLTLIEPVDGHFALNLGHEGFQGDVLIDGSIVPIADMANTGKLRGDQLVITGPVRARIRLGEFILLISYGPMPERPKISPLGSVDITPHIYTAISAVVHIAFLLFLSLVPEAQLRSKLDPDARRARLVSILKVTKPEEEKKDPEEEQRRLEEEQKKKERLKVQQTEIRQPDRNPRLLDKLSRKQEKVLDELSRLSAEERKRRLQEIAATAGAAKLLEEDKGLLAALLDTSNADAFQEKFRTLASVGGDENPNGAAGSIDPFGGTLGASGASGGFVGSTSIGRGRGGAGGDGALIDGLDKNATRRDLDDIRLRERPMTPVAIASSAKVSGRLDRKTVQKIIRRNLSGIKWCYQDALQRDPKIRGKVTLSFTILPNGRLQNPTAQNPSLNDPKLLDCIMAKMKRWRFPVPKDGGVVKVTYPLILKTR